MESKAKTSIKEVRNLPYRELPSKVGKPITIKTRLRVIDNTGSKQVEMIGTIKKGNTAKRYPSAGCGEIIRAVIKQGTDKSKVIHFLITGCKKPYFRKTEGIHVVFSENTGIILEKNKNLYKIKDTKIKGPVAKECSRRFPTLKTHAILV